MTHRAVDNGEFPTIVPEHDVYLRLSIPQMNIKEEYIATLFKLREVHAEGYNIISTFDYIEPFDKLLLQEYNISLNDQEKVLTSQVPRYLQLYGDSRFMKMLAESIQNYSTMEKSTSEVKLNLLLPPSGKDYQEEHLQLSLNQIIKNETFVKISFDNYAVIRKEEDVIEYSKKVAEQEDIQKIFEYYQQFAAKISAQNEPLNPAMKSQSPLELVISLLGFKKLNEGFVVQERSKEISIFMHLKEPDSVYFAGMILHLFTNIFSIKT